MIPQVVFAAAMLCPQPLIVNKTTEDWTKIDKQTIEQAKKRCGEIYPTSPCLKAFSKVDEQTYAVVCGASPMIKKPLEDLRLK